MDETGNLVHKNKVINVSEIISTLLEDIKSNAGSSDSHLKELSKLKILKEKCCDADPSLSVTAFQGLVLLVEAGLINGVHALSTLISLLPSVSNISGLVTTIGNLLLLDFRHKLSKTGSYACQFAVMDKQHPLITVLKYNKTKSWDSVYAFICSVFWKNSDMSFEYRLEVVRPILMYIFCDPSPTASLSKFQVFNLLLNHTSDINIQNFLFEILMWQPLDMNYCWLLLQFSQFLSRSHIAGYEKMVTALVPYLCLAVVWLILNGHNPTLWLDELSCDLNISREAASSVVYMLADVILHTPAMYINQVVELCKNIIVHQNCNKFVAFKVAAAVLNWLVNPSPLVEPLPRAATEIITIVQTTGTKWNDESSKLMGNRYYNILRNSQPQVKLAVDVAKMTDSWMKDENLILKWLENISKADCDHLQTKMHLLLSGIVLSQRSEIILDRTLQILIKSVGSHTTLSFPTLCLIFLKLSQETEPSMQLKFLLLIPKLAVEKDNVPLIIGTIATLQGGTNRIMAPLMIRLYLRLWQTEARTYPYLYKMLTAPHAENNNIWELTVSKAVAMREICKTAPDLHGKDLVALLSEILNQCDGNRGGLASAIAIDAIRELCRAHVIDIAGTWRALEPKLSRDKRTQVLTSLCHLLSEVPALRSPESEYDTLTSNVIARLWGYIVSKDMEVVRASMRALGRFHPESHSLKLMPEQFKRGLTLPKEYAKTSVEAGRKAEDVLPYVPGECWVQFLEKMSCETLDNGGDMLMTMVKMEMDSLPHGLFYLAPGKAEPSNYNYLPHQSICRALVGHVQREIQSNALQLRPSAVQSLRILAGYSGKPLPPLNWSFLEDLVNYKESSSTENCLTLLAKQAFKSESAKQIVENYTKKFVLNSDEVKSAEFLYSMLPNLCNIVQPNSLRPFLEKSISGALKSAISGNPRLLRIIISSIRTTLQENDVNEANKTLAVMQMESILPMIHPGHQVMKDYAECAAEFPKNFIERISSPSVWWETTAEKLERAIAIRSAIALKTDCAKPLFWLNECIDAVASMPDLQTLVSQSVLNIAQKCRNNQSNSKWLLELMYRTQASITLDNDSYDSEQVTVLLLDMFMGVVIVLSGYDCLVENLDHIIGIREDRFRLFPISLYELFSQANWTEHLPQVVEWLHRLSKRPELPKSYCDVLEQGILSLKTFKYCTDGCRWSRLFYFRVAVS